MLQTSSMSPVVKMLDDLSFIIHFAKNQGKLNQAEVWFSVSGFLPMS